MTVSFFLKRSKDRSKGIRDAIIYGISIIVIYVALGSSSPPSSEPTPSTI